eukprot:12883279-Prorocentrum_lima.AAC.1
MPYVQDHEALRNTFVFIDGSCGSYPSAVAGVWLKLLPPSGLHQIEDVLHHSDQTYPSKDHEEKH